MLSVVNNDEAGAEGRFGLDEMCREGARTMLAAALEAEVDAYLAALVDERDDDGHRLVTRNGHARHRKVQTVAGAVEITAARVNDKRVDETTSKKAQFRSSIAPPWRRRSPKVTEVLPLLYLHGLSTGDFAPALEGFFGAAAGLSASVITRLTTTWQNENRAFMARNLATVTTCTSGPTGPLQRAPRGGTALLSRDRRGAPRRQKGARRDRGRLPGVHRLLGGIAPGLASPRHAGTGRRCWRRCTRVLGGTS